MMRKKPGNEGSIGVGKVLLYSSKDGDVELRVDSTNDTLWATQEQMGKLFEVDIRTISEHLKNIFAEDELHERSVVRKFRITAKDGKRYLTQTYDLDAIIAVGYRVNSKKATQFRIWATRILRQYVLNGYSLNERKLKAESDRLEDVYDALDYIESGEGQGKVKSKITLRITKDLS